MVALASALLGILASPGPVELTPARLVDDLVAKYGYGVVGTSCKAQTPLTIPNPTNLVDAGLRLKARWRVVPDDVMPGVYRTVAAPYEDLFAEFFDGMPKVQILARDPIHPSRESDVTITETASGAERKPLPEVALKDLFKPGGARLSVLSLARLLRVPADEIPRVYENLTALVRIDPRRPVAPLPLLAAISGGAIGKDGRFEVEPRRYRKLATETLRMEAAKGIRTDPDKVVRMPEIQIPEGMTVDTERHPPLAAVLGAFERERPSRLMLGAEAFEAATDEQLRTAGAQRSEPGLALMLPGLEERHPGFRAIRARAEETLGLRGCELAYGLTERPILWLWLGSGLAEFGDPLMKPVE